MELQRLHNSKFWLWTCAIGLVLVNLDLSWKIIGNFDKLTVSALFWTAILYLLWTKRFLLDFKSDVFSSFLGLSIIIAILGKSISLFWFESFYIKLSALFSFLGLGLLASGIKGLKQYKQEFLVLLLLLFPDILENLIFRSFDISELAAKFTTFLFWYLGFNVSRQGIDVILPTGTIEIYPGCSGLNAIITLLQLGLLLILVFPLTMNQKFIIPFAGIFFAFFINIFRLILMALLVASHNHEGFEYWHGSPGAGIFSTISILTFGCFCYFLLRNEPKLNNCQ